MCDTLHTYNGQTDKKRQDSFIKDSIVATEILFCAIVVGKNMSTSNFCSNTSQEKNSVRYHHTYGGDIKNAQFYHHIVHRNLGDATKTIDWVLECDAMT